MAGDPAMECPNGILQQKRVVERARMEEQNREFAREKAKFAREERAYLLKYRAMVRIIIEYNTSFKWVDRRIVSN
eukprot:5886843-Pyramimonas_sp.AAC.1